MDAENPTSLRHLFVRVAATLLALVGLYVLSTGPAAYAAVKHPNIQVLGDIFYRPLGMAIRGSALEKPYRAYALWWARLAGWKPAKHRVMAKPDTE